MSLIADLDVIAGSGRSPWHRASALSKMLLALTLVSLALVFSEPRPLLAIHAVAWLVALTSRLPARLLIAAVAYPALFSLFFLILTWSGRAADQVWLLRPLTAGLVAVWLIGTTPYPDLFAPISRVVPRAIGDALFLSYRTVFALMTSLEQMMRAVKLRGGDTGSPWRRWSVAGEGLGTLLLEGFERGERLYATMLLRGHDGRICGCRHWLEWTKNDLWVLMMFLVLMAALRMVGGLG